METTDYLCCEFKFLTWKCSVPSYTICHLPNIAMKAQVSDFIFITFSNVLSLTWYFWSLEAASTTFCLWKTGGEKSLAQWMVLPTVTLLGPIN